MDSEGATSVPAPVLPGYEMIRPLGTGGTSTVWLARQRSLDRLVAVKVLSSVLLGDDGAREQFRAEARVAAKVHHPAIVGVVDAGEVEGALYYVMEYVEGTDLAQVLMENGPLPKKVVLQIAEILGGALGEVWRELGMIHGDIKPGNIMLQKDGAIRLADFGLARVVHAEIHAADTQEMIEGTPTYLAPEQIRGEGVDCRVDIYALGLTLYHLLTGKAPFEGYSLRGILEAQQTDFLPDPCTLVTGLSPSVAWLLAKMTAKEAVGRQADWGAVLEDVGLVARGKRPKPPYPAEDGATILISTRNRPTARASVNPNAIRLTAREGASMGRRGIQQKGLAMGTLVRVFIFLVLLCVGMFTAWKFELARRIREGIAGTKRRPAPVRAVAVGGVEEGEGEALEDDLSISGGTGTLVEGAWSQPQFVSAATLFNGALARYQAATQAVGGTGWGEMIRDAESAAVLFEAIKPMAPESVPVRFYANQCYQLVKDCRRAAMSAREKAEGQQYARKRRDNGLAPWPAPDWRKDPFASRYMNLGYAWEVLPAPRGARDATDYVIWMAPRVEASPSTKADPKQAIFYGLKWMMPLKDALVLLGQTNMLPRKMATGAVVPYGGIFHVEMAAPARYSRIPSGQKLVTYPKLRLILDAEDQLIAVQLVDDAPTGVVEQATSAFSPNYATVDFITGRQVGGGKGEAVAYEIRRAGETLRLDVEAADLGEGRPVFRSVLMLPKGLANIFAYHVMGLGGG